MRNRRYHAQEFFKKAKNIEKQEPGKPTFDKVYCIYHDKDLDGVLSAAIIKNEYPEAVLIPFDYGYKLDLNQIEEKAAVFMVDCSLPDDEMLFLNKKTELYLFDHHYRSCNNEICKSLKGIRTLNQAACLIVYDFFHPFSIIPKGIKLAAYYDARDKSNADFWNREVIPFQYGMRQFPLYPHAKIYQQVIESKSDFIDKIIEDGDLIIRYQKSQAFLTMEKYSYSSTLECDGKTYSVLVLNRQLVSFEFFLSHLDKEKHQFCVAYQERDGKYHYSLRSWAGSVNVGRIAAYFDPKMGGGHRYASGFIYSKNIFSKEKI